MSVQCGLCCRNAVPRTHHARLMVEVIHGAPRRQRDDTVYLDADGFLFVAQNFPQIETYRTERTVVVVHDVQFSREVIEHFMCQHVDHLRIVCLSNPLLGSFFAEWRCPCFLSFTSCLLNSSLRLHTVSLDDHLYEIFILNCPSVVEHTASLDDYLYKTFILNLPLGCRTDSCCCLDNTLLIMFSKSRGAHQTLPLIVEVEMQFKYGADIKQNTGCR